MRRQRADAQRGTSRCSVDCILLNQTLCSEQLRCSDACPSSVCASSEHGDEIVKSSQLYGHVCVVYARGTAGRIGCHSIGGCAPRRGGCRERGSTVLQGFRGSHHSFDVVSAENGVNFGLVENAATRSL